MHTDHEDHLRQVTAQLDGLECISSVPECSDAAKNGRVSMSKPHEGSKYAVHCFHSIFGRSL